MPRYVVERTFTDGLPRRDQTPNRWRLRLLIRASLYGRGQPRVGLLVQRQTERFGPIEMEQLWNRRGETAGKGSGRQKPANRLN